MFSLTSSEINIHSLRFSWPKKSSFQNTIYFNYWTVCNTHSLITALTKWPLLHPALTHAAHTHTHTHTHTHKEKDPYSLNSVPCPLSYPVLSHSEQDTVLSFSGPSDPCCPHPLQRSPEAQQVHTSRPETNLTSTKPSLILTSCPSVPARGRFVLGFLVCVCAGISCCGKQMCECMCVCVCVCVFSWNHKSDDGRKSNLGSWFFISSLVRSVHNLSFCFLKFPACFTHAHAHAHTHTHTHTHVQSVHKVCFHTCSSVHVVWISEWVVTQLHFFLWFSFVSQAKYQVNQNVSTEVMWELSVCSLVRNHVSQVLSFSHSLNILNTGCQTVWSTLDSCLCHNKLPTVCLQSRPQPVMHSTAGYRSWFSPKICSSSAAGAHQSGITFIWQMNCTKVCS